MKFSADASAILSKSRNRFRLAWSRRSRSICTLRITCSRRVIASWFRCKAPGFPSLTATRRNSFPTFLKRRNRTIRKPRSASTVRNAFRRAWKFPCCPTPTLQGIESPFTRETLGFGSTRAIGLFGSAGQMRYARRRREPYNVIFLVHRRNNSGNQGCILAEGDRVQRRRAYRRSIVFRHGLENLVADPAKGYKPDSFFKPHLRNLFLVL